MHVKLCYEKVYSKRAPYSPFASRPLDSGFVYPSENVEKKFKNFKPTLFALQKAPRAYAFYHRVRTVANERVVRHVCRPFSDVSSYFRPS